jgi:hypothetical protein
VTEAQAIEAIYEQFVSAWSTLQPSVTTIALGNEVLDDPPATWVRITVRHSVRMQATMGPPGVRRWESRGRIAIQLFGDVNVGDGPLATLADSARAALEGVSLVVANSNLFTQAGTSNEGMNGGASGNNAGDGRWAMKLVSIPFWYQATS